MSPGRYSPRFRDTEKQIGNLLWKGNCGTRQEESSEQMNKSFKGMSPHKDLFHSELTIKTGNRVPQMEKVFFL